MGDGRFSLFPLIFVTRTALLHVKVGKRAAELVWSQDQEETEIVLHLFWDLKLWQVEFFCQQLPPEMRGILPALSMKTALRLAVMIIRNLC